MYKSMISLTVDSKINYKSLEQCDKENKGFNTKKTREDF